MTEILRVLKEDGKLILIGEPVIPAEYLGQDEEYQMQKEKGFNEHQYTAVEWISACTQSVARLTSYYGRWRINRIK